MKQLIITSSRILVQTIVAFLLANLIYFVIAITKVNKHLDWSFSFSDGMFTINGEPVGMEWGSPQAIGFMIFIALGLTIYYIYKSNLVNKAIANNH